MLNRVCNARFEQSGMQGDKKKEEKLTAQFKELFQPYDIMS